MDEITPTLVPKNVDFLGDFNNQVLFIEIFFKYFMYKKVNCLNTYTFHKNFIKFFDKNSSQSNRSMLI